MLVELFYIKIWRECSSNSISRWFFSETSMCIFYIVIYSTKSRSLQNLHYSHIISIHYCYHNIRHVTLNKKYIEIQGINFNRTWNKFAHIFSIKYTLYKADSLNYILFALYLHSFLCLLLIFIFPQFTFTKYLSKTKCHINVDSVSFKFRLVKRDLIFLPIF